MLKVTGSLSESFHPTGYEHTYSATFATNPVARRIGHCGRLFKKSASKMTTALPSTPTFAAGQALWNPRNSSGNAESNSKLSISDWNLMASASLHALREDSIAELQQPATLFTRDQCLSSLPATGFWRDLPDVELSDGPLSVEPFAYARRSVQAGRADESALNLH